MKINKNLEPVISGISAAIVIGILAYLTMESILGIWLMFSFGATVFLVFVLYIFWTPSFYNCWNSL